MDAASAATDFVAFAVAASAMDEELAASEAVTAA
jgi:hypothetical protein